MAEGLDRPHRAKRFFVCGVPFEVGQSQPRDKDYTHRTSASELAPHGKDALSAPVAGLRATVSAPVLGVLHVGAVFLTFRVSWGQGRGKW